MALQTAFHCKTLATLDTSEGFCAWTTRICDNFYGRRWCSTCVCCSSNDLYRRGSRINGKLSADAVGIRVPRRVRCRVSGSRVGNILISIQKRLFGVWYIKWVVVIKIFFSFHCKIKPKTKYCCTFFNILGRRGFDTDFSEPCSNIMFANGPSFCIICCLSDRKLDGSVGPMWRFPVFSLSSSDTSSLLKSSSNVCCAVTGGGGSQCKLNGLPRLTLPE